MKKQSILCLSLCVLMGTANVSAQGFLKKLGKALTPQEQAQPVQTQQPAATRTQTQVAPAQPEKVASNEPTAQNVLKIHFTDASKKIVIPKYGAVFPEIHEGMIVLSNYPKQMIANATTGEYVFGTDFSFSLVGFRDTYTPYFSGGAIMANLTGDNNGFAILYPDGKYRVLPKDIRLASPFVEGYALVQRQPQGTYTTKQVFIDKNGKEVFPALASTPKSTFGDMTVYPVCENRRVYYNAELGKYGYADANGAIVIKPQFDKALNFSEGLAAVMTKENYQEKWGFIDLSGKMVIPATFKLRPGRFSEGLAAVRIGDSESSYEMTYIDKTGKRMMETKPWDLNEFHNGYALVGTGCDKLFVIDKEFNEVRDITKTFYQGGNGMGTCSFKMLTGKVTDRIWGIDFPGGMQMLNQQGVDAGHIYAPDGTVIYSASETLSGVQNVCLHYTPESDLFFVEARFKNEPRLKEQDVFMACFVNKKGEIIYYFEEGVEGYEGPKPVQVK
jgi:hypothetical protein